MTASATHGVGYEVPGKSKHKTVYKVTGVGATTAVEGHQNLDAAIAAARALLQQAEAAGASTPPGTLPQPTTVMISSSHSLPAYREEPSGLHPGAPRGAY